MKLTPEEIRVVWRESWQKQNTNAELDDEELSVVEDILKAQLAKDQRADPEWKGKIGDLISGFVNKQSFTSRGLDQILALMPSVEQAILKEKERIEGLLSFTVEIKGNTVIVDKHDWDNFWRVLKEEK